MATIKAANLWVTFVMGQEDREATPVGPFEFAQITYNSLQVGTGNGDVEFIADYIDDWWVTKDGQKWSDIIIATDY